MHSSRSIRRYSSLAATGFVILMGVAVAAQTMKINGAGATFPVPDLLQVVRQYNRLKPTVEINYQSIGSGGGIRQITNGTVFFGATDGPMTEDQLQAAPGRILHLPTVLGADVPVYNIPGVDADLNSASSAGSPCRRCCSRGCSSPPRLPASPSGPR